LIKWFLVLILPISPGASSNGNLLFATKLLLYE
jgi:hypothetical protein